MRSTYTYVTMELSQAAYDEIRTKMEAAGYQHAIEKDGTIDMHGLAVIPPHADIEKRSLSDKLFRAKDQSVKL